MDQGSACPLCFGRRNTEKLAHSLFYLQNVSIGLDQLILLSTTKNCCGVGVHLGESIVRIAEYVFWVCLFLIAYAYIFYPIVLFIAYVLSQVRRDWQYLTGRRNRRASALAAEQLPTVTLIVPAHNEQTCLSNKIVNLRQIDYPVEKLQIVIVSDGSTDLTNKILSSLEDPKIEVVLLPKRRGKSEALNIAVSHAHHDILVFSDTSTLFAPKAVKNLTRHFSNPKVGVVCGALEFERTSESKQTEGIYWEYESMLRLMEARLGATLTASGALFASRRSAFRLLAPETIIEDFVIPMNARNLGYSVVYDPEATATEIAASSVVGEFTRRVRLAVGSFQALKGFLTTSLDGFTSVAFVSHKLLRWILPFLLIALLVSNVFLIEKSLYRAVFVGQLLFFLWAWMGFIFRRRVHGVRYALVGYFLLAMNLAFLIGFLRFVTGREEGVWQRVN
jgi:cellulose synthase/poly-beta-1,6-N-acetylglucosamine synthase-like glycosyltransferase